MVSSWDVIVVGARCSGATLAARLARHGLRVALVEAAARGADMPMSTHLVQPPGMDVLDRLGVGARVRAVTPPTHRMCQALDEVAAVGFMPPGRSAYCIRRALLDPWLQDAAEESGATLLDHHRVVDLVREEGRVRGVIARTARGTVELHAPLVVGADGPRSTVAVCVGAEEYLASEGSRAGYWSYYRAPVTWTAEWDALLEHKGDDLRYAFRCDSGLVLLLYMGPQERVNGWGRDYQAQLEHKLHSSERTRSLCEGQTPVGKTMGLLKTRFFYRKPVGAGWALVGDAGHFKDFVTGQGIADALLDAERLSDAILDGRPEAYEAYWRERDVLTLPLHFDAIRQGEVGFNTPMMRWFMRCVGERPDLVARMTEVFDRKLPPHAFIPPHTMLGMVGGAVARGKVDVLASFLRTGRRIAGEMVELSRRQRLASSAHAELERAPMGAPFGSPRSAGEADEMARSLVAAKLP